MKRYKLREEVKLILMVGVIITLVVTSAFVAADRNEKINNGEIVVISESQMDR